ncbi:AAA family ATPase (plasmid) [Thermovibrio ammonificans HB-1]|uniref:AAA family ATPase n=1 Tax=Thermovibrio ammonificans (strain DSM 15698 / JCM 12110 / HB-1) TaxID=648996 RepID=E8T6T1_THEA1|nr:AAA family ATPase [Thermovibrio ammonificans HB-1]
MTFPMEKVKQAVRFVISTAGLPDLDDALFNCWQVSSVFTDEERELLSLAQTIVSGTKDGFVKPEEFNVYDLAAEVARELDL